ncbi:hypothetical protein ABTZ57_01480 [Streptomyces sp. NPDC094048]|uniref:phage distal tail protein n=2 Tax=unclassified Streptomyces TaxID=2593676 RepID=UPI003317A01D
MAMPGLQPGYRFTDLLVRLGEVVFGQVDQDGVHWHCEDNEGWDSPDSRSTLTQREGDHGAYAGPVYLNERVITLTGKVTAQSAAALDGAIDQLKVAASLTDTTLTVYETVPKQATVRRSGRPLIKRLTDRTIDYSVQVTAADPRLYATSETVVPLRLPTVTDGQTWPVAFPSSFPAVVVSGDTTVTNAGNLDARPRIVIAGPVAQPAVTVTGPDGTAATLLYSGTVSDGDYLDLDCDLHTAYYNGSASRRALVSGTWPVLQPGVSGLAFRAGTYSSTATLTVAYRSAWM